MIVKSLHMASFMSYKASTSLHLPDAGIVLVTGENGVGKSSLIEAVSVALWGKTLRGTAPWHDGVDCVARVNTDALDVRRTRTAKGETGLDWAHLDPAVVDAKFDTMTKAQKELNREIAPHDVWRRTCVFSSQDAAHFTLATDAERKRLLETLLGLERFDAALDACRKDVRASEKRVAKAQREHDVHAERTRGEEDRRARAQAELDALPAGGAPVGECEARIADLDEQVRKIAKDITTARDRSHANQRTIDLAVDKVKQAEREHARSEKGECPTCARPWDASHVEHTRVALEAARAAEAATREECAARIASFALEVEELEEERAAVSELRGQWMVRMNEATTLAAQRSRLETVLGEAVLDHEAAATKLAELATELSAAKSEAGELAATERVLSLTGVRSKLLTDALGGIETIANTWLGRIAGWGMRLELKPYAEKASGGVKDAISLQVHGAGGGHGYHAASAGQRRRIDVALLLALADIANASRGVARSTLWFDEVFDALDADGVDAVCSVVEELARDRPLVLITHNPALKQRLSAQSVTLRVHVHDGALEFPDDVAQGV